MASGDGPDAKKSGPQRLPSLRGPRDLSLSAFALPSAAAGPSSIKKKNFAPVLPSQAKAKPKAEIVSEFAPPPEVKLKSGALRHADRIKFDGDRGAGRGRGNRRDIPIDPSKFVQMKSAFSDGPMMMTPNSRSHSGLGARNHLKSESPSDNFRRSGGGGGGSGAERIGADGDKAEPMELEMDTKAVLEELLRDDFVHERFASSLEPDLAPVRLPVSYQLRPDAKCDPSIKTDVSSRRLPKVAKSDPARDGEAMDTSTLSTVTPQPPSQSAVLHASDLFNPDSAFRDELLLFQLPDALPGIPFAKESASGPATSKGSSTDSQRFKLGDFEESAIGRLVVRRSGRTQLVLGKVSFDVNLGSTASFLQDLACLRTDETSPPASGSLTVLGHVRHKLLCIPDLDQLLRTMNCTGS